MTNITLVDTYTAFMQFWLRVDDRPMEFQIEAWAGEYMAQYPELLQKQIDDYAEQGEDWRQIASRHVFPYLNERLAAMDQAHRNILTVGPSIIAQAKSLLAFDFDPAFVIYVGIGCGAGWATTYERRPAVLFGLENIAECGWSEPSALKGLIAHELSHLVHFEWRKNAGIPEGSGPWWQLYSEGFAQYGEHLIQGNESWHMRRDEMDGQWLAWCRLNCTRLAAEFLRAVDHGEDIKPFFGSWFEIEGHKQTGYFLGHEIVRRMTESISLQDLALINSDDYGMRPQLEALAQDL